jgi:hypothetical protein
MTPPLIEVAHQRSTQQGGSKEPGHRALRADVVPFDPRMIFAAQLRARYQVSP